MDLPPRSLIQMNPEPRHEALFFRFFGFLFVCFFVLIKPENPHFASRAELQVKLLGV